jgi:hypothetical protein
VLHTLEAVVVPLMQVLLVRVGLVEVVMEQIVFCLFLEHPGQPILAAVLVEGMILEKVKTAALAS